MPRPENITAQDLEIWEKIRVEALDSNLWINPLHKEIAGVPEGVDLIYAMLWCLDRLDEMNAPVWVLEKTSTTLMMWNTRQLVKLLVGVGAVEDPWPNVIELVRLWREETPDAKAE